MPETVKTFYPTTPVEFSSSLLAELDSSLESNYTRKQYAKQYIEKEVSKRLGELEKQGNAQLDKQIADSLLTDKGDSVSVASVNENLSKVYSHLKELNASAPKKTPELVAAESKVVSCLTSNKGQPLNCWNEVEAFRKLASEL